VFVARRRGHRRAIYGRNYGKKVSMKLLELDLTERSAMLETLRAWRDAGGSTAVAAERLFCHRNTVRNRLQRIESMTNRSLDEPLGCGEVCMALDAWTLLGDEALR
jgi:DNA-binding PucR family transcriptional regulator